MVLSHGKQQAVLETHVINYVINIHLICRCVVSWNDELKWCLFGPNLAFGGVSFYIMVSNNSSTNHLHGFKGVGCL